MFFSLGKMQKNLHIFTIVVKFGEKAQNFVRNITLWAFCKNEIKNQFLASSNFERKTLLSTSFAVSSCGSLSFIKSFSV